ncbi:biotin transporter BioY [Bacteriovorax sp. DB6_IX]|uniref:biotin transporter BioY n=1 Tax=Bacteriovorax sp. DB6_IX TaxID=1353530 RepID=UPI00038A1567|nr:biotin transporter BioY [Bacteriovorax sp. DB6_IX]EQC50599.1 BioY family protein [Bacteriovorax sp. DB6_IX]
MDCSIYTGTNNFMDVKFKSSLKKGHLTNLLLIVAGVVFLALMAQVAIELPFSPVPITGQTLGVLIIGSLYGARRATMTTLSYLVVGAVGMPVFSAGSFGLAKILGPTGGYLIGFVIAAAVMGIFAQHKKDRNLWHALVSFAIGHTLVFACGLTWLSFYVGVDKTFQLGLFPFIPGMIVKTVLAAGVTSTIWQKS